MNQLVRFTWISDQLIEFNVCAYRAQTPKNGEERCRMYLNLLPKVEGNQGRA